MKNPDRDTVAHLDALPNIGPAMARDLRRVGIDHPLQLRGRDADELYRKLCEVTGRRHDPCVIDVFRSAIRFMEGDEARPWWAYTPLRKAAERGE